MLTFLPGPIRGIMAFISYISVIVVLGIYIFILAPLKFLVPHRKWQDFFTRRYRRIPHYWSITSDFIMRATTKIKWQVRQHVPISKLRSYIVIANHQSWMDILAIQKVLDKIAPPSVYFMKRELIWFPILGLGCYLMGFPFMRRYSKVYLEKHPEKCGLDLKSTRKTCQKYKRFPVSLISFPEGTRFSSEKCARQKSPYKHLLKPRAGGLAHALNAMGEQVKTFIDITIVYQRKYPKVLSFFTGKAKKILIDINSREIEPQLRGDYDFDHRYREYFQAWVNKLWTEKDEMIEALGESV